MTRRIASAVLVLLAIAASAMVFLTPSGHGDNLTSEPVSRLLIVSMPGVAWSDVRSGSMPTLRDFAATAAVGDMSTRIGRRNAGATDAYLTMGAGTRATAPDVDVAVAVDAEDRYGGVSTADILRRRLGVTTFDGIAYLAVGAARDANRNSVYGAEVGLLGQALSDGGIERSVIANADALEGFLDEATPPEGYYARSAVTMLMDREGIVPSGAVGRNLLVDDPAAAFGTRVDTDAVVDAFESSWASPGSVVLVEASDLSRVSAYRKLATPQQRRDLRAAAVARADDLLARLLASVDPETDAVMVLSPVSPRAQPALGLAAVTAPGLEPGLLESPTTRRVGYVQLADVAPTVLELMGLDFPSEIEGRSFHSVHASGSDRWASLADAADAARFRDSFLPAVVTVVVAAIAAVLAAGLLRHRLPRGLARLIRPAAYATLGIVPGTFVAPRFDFAHADAAGHWVVIVVAAAVVATAATALDSIDRRLGPLFAVAVTAVLVVGDVLTGAHLQMNSVFGYSMAVAGRFTGLGNLAYALLGSSAVVVAALVFDLFGRRSLGFLAVALGVVVLADGLPMVGADVGGVMSLVPAFAATLMILSRRRIDLRHVLGSFAAAAVAVFVFAFIDAARPSQTHTHLARLADHVLESRWDTLANIVGRRWQASFGSLELAGLGTVTVALLVAVVYAEIQVRRRQGRLSRPSPLRSLDAAPLAVRAGVVGVAILGVVGLVLNDSSVAVPLTVLIVAVPAYVARSLSEVVPT